MSALPLLLITLFVFFVAFILIGSYIIFIILNVFFSNLLERILIYALSFYFLAPKLAPYIAEGEGQTKVWTYIIAAIITGTYWFLTKRLNEYLPRLAIVYHFLASIVMMILWSLMFPATGDTFFFLHATKFPIVNNIVSTFIYLAIFYIIFSCRLIHADIDFNLFQGISKWIIKPFSPLIKLLQKLLSSDAIPSFMRKEDYYDLED